MIVILVVVIGFLIGVAAVVGLRAWRETNDEWAEFVTGIFICLGVWNVYDGIVPALFGT